MNEKAIDSWDSPWLDQSVDGIGTSDLDGRALAYSRKRVTEAHAVGGYVPNLSDEMLLGEMGLMVEGNITRAGVLLFHPHPEDLIIGSFTKLGMFIGPEIVTQDLIGGPLVCRYHRILETLRIKYLSKMITYHGWTRVEVDPFPEVALRECILNALVHNDYGSFNPVQMRFWPEKAMISDSGGMPEGMTVGELLRTPTPMPVNPRIARVFSMMGLTENRGLGMGRILGCYEDKEDRGVEVRAGPGYFQVTMDAVITLEDIRDRLFQ